MAIEKKKQQIWKYAARYGFTRTIRGSVTIATQVVQGQAIRTRTMPPVTIQFNKHTKQFSTRDPEVADLIQEDELFRRKDNPKGQYWLVEGYPKTTGPDVSSEPEVGPEPKVDGQSGPPISKYGVRSTGHTRRKK